MPVVLMIVVGLAFTYIFTTTDRLGRYFQQMAETNTRMQQLDAQAARECYPDADQVRAHWRLCLQPCWVLP